MTNLKNKRFIFNDIPTKLQKQMNEDDELYERFYYNNSVIRYSDYKEHLEDYREYRFWLRNYRSEKSGLQLICNKIKEDLKEKYNLESFDFLAEDLIIIKILG